MIGTQSDLVPQPVCDTLLCPRVRASVLRPLVAPHTLGTFLAIFGGHDAINGLRVLFPVRWDAGDDEDHDAKLDLDSLSCSNGRVTADFEARLLCCVFHHRWICRPSFQYSYFCLFLQRL